MALKGTLTADFESFYSAVRKAEVELQGFEAEAHKVETRLTTASNAFQGNKIVSQATIAVEAIERIGGASKLTDAEQAKVNKTLSEAIEKYTRLGKVAPDAWLEVEKATRKADDQTKQVPSSLDAIGGSLMKIAGTIGIAFTADALVGFVGSVFSAAGQIQDMSEKLGISAEAVQKFKYAAEQAGGSIETVDRALFEMNKRLGEGEKGTVAALEMLGLKFDEIRNKDPEQAFLDITEAIRQIDDPMLQAKLATEAFGKAGADLLPAIKAGFKDVGAEAGFMSDDTVQALADAEDAWARLKNAVVIYTGTIIATTIDGVSKITSSWKGFFTFAEMAIKQGPAAALASMAMLQQAENAAARQETQETKRDERRRQSTREYINDANDRAKALEEEAKRAEADAKRIAGIHSQLFGFDKIAAAKDIVAAVGDVSRLTKLTADEQQRVNTAMAAAIEIYGKFGDVAPKAMNDFYYATFRTPPVVAGLGAEVAKFGEVVTVGGQAAVEASNAAQAAWQAEQDAMYAANEARAKVVEPGIDKAKQLTQANKELAASYTLVARSAAEYTALAAQAEADAAINMRRGGIAAQYGMFQTEQARSLRQKASEAAGREAYIAQQTGGGIVWGNRGMTSTTTNLNVNVNNADAQGIANKLMTELRHAGVRFG